MRYCEYEPGDFPGDGMRYCEYEPGDFPDEEFVPYEPLNLCVHAMAKPPHDDRGRLLGLEGEKNYHLPPDWISVPFIARPDVERFKEMGYFPGADETIAKSEGPDQESGPTALST